MNTLGSTILFICITILFFSWKSKYEKKTDTLLQNNDI